LKRDGRLNGHRRKVKKPVKRRKKKTSDPAKRNIRQLAKEIGQSRQTLYTWEKEGCPLDQGAEAVKEWRNKHKSNGHDASEHTLLLQVRARKLAAEAEAQESDNLRRKGQMYSRDQVELNAVEMTSMIRNRLESVPNEIVQELPIDIRPTVLELLENRVYLILTEMSQWRLA